MIELKPIDYHLIQHWHRDFQNKNGNYENPPDYVNFVGIFDGPRIVGYFALAGYEDGVLEIQQGYLCKEVRHEGYEFRAMRQLEKIAKENHYTKIILQARRSLKAYQKFMKRLDFNIEEIVFTKILGDTNEQSN